MTHQLDDQMALLSQYYPAVYKQLAPPDQQEGEAKPRRRRRKNKAGGSSNGGGEFRKRKLNQEQVNLLEQSFGDEHKLESERKDKLAAELGLDPRQVAVWFQNRRARWKSKKLEEEYSELKSEHDNAVVENCRLESEVLRLKDQLSEAEKEIQRLLESSSKSPSSSSFSMEAMEMQPPFLGGFGMEGLENVFYVPESNYIHGLEWDNLYI